MKIRAARRSDKDKILSFCADTFSWGDYIERVWDSWYADRSGRLLVAKDGGRSIAVSHVALCPRRKIAWLEGIRVHPDFRRSKVASRLIERMVRYGRQKGAHEVSAIVASDNIASRHMMEKSGFSMISRWAYCGINEKVRRQKSDARFAAAHDLNDIWRYLQESKVYELSARRYVRSWRWYPLDRRSLQSFVKRKQVIMTGRPIDGVAIINISGYWDKTNVLQLVYLDSSSKDSLHDLVSFAASLYTLGGFDGFHILCHQSLKPAAKLRIEESEQFLLYNKVFTP